MGVTPDSSTQVVLHAVNTEQATLLVLNGHLELHTDQHLLVISMSLFYMILLHTCYYLIENYTYIYIYMYVNIYIYRERDSHEKDQNTQGVVSSSSHETHIYFLVIGNYRWLTKVRHQLCCSFGTLSVKVSAISAIIWCLMKQWNLV